MYQALHHSTLIGIDDLNLLLTLKQIRLKKDEDSKIAHRMAERRCREKNFGNINKFRKNGHIEKVKRGEDEWIQEYRRMSII